MADIIRANLPPINVPIIDPATRLMNEGWYKFLEDIWRRTGGEIDAVATAANQSAQNSEDIVEVRAYQVTAGSGLLGGGPISEGVSLSAKSDDDWTFSTGAGDKTTPYSVPAAFTVSNPPTQGEVQAIGAALVALSARYVALEAALAANEAIKS